MKQKMIERRGTSISLCINFTCVRITILPSYSIDAYMIFHVFII